MASIPSLQAAIEGRNDAIRDITTRIESHNRLEVNRFAGAQNKSQWHQSEIPVNFSDASAKKTSKTNRNAPWKIPEKNYKFFREISPAEHKRCLSNRKSTSSP